MKPVDNQLNRLLKSAAAVPTPAPGAPEFAVEARVMGAWRGTERADNGEFMLAWFRRAAICGCLLAIATLAWDFQGRTNHGGAELTIADSAMGMGVEP
jgi:hypothetical protein